MLIYYSTDAQHTEVAPVSSGGLVLQILWVLEKQEGSIHLGTL